MLKKLTIALCIITCFVGCSLNNTDQKVLNEARQEILKQKCDVEYYNALVNDIVHFKVYENGDETYYYYHNSGKYYLGESEMDEKMIVEDYSSESVVIDQEVNVLQSILDEELEIEHVSTFSDQDNNCYYYQIPSNVLQKYRLIGDYQIVIIEEKNKIINIRLFLKHDEQSYQYFLNLLIGHPTISKTGVVSRGPCRRDG